MKLAKPVLTILGGLGLALLSPGIARANTIGPNCGSCYGNTYTMTYYQTAAQAGTQNYTLQLLIDASGFQAGPDSAYLMSIAPNVPGWNNATLISAPGGLANWNDTGSGGLNDDGCNGHGSPDFCNSALSQGSFNEVGTTTPMTFAWTLSDATPLDQLSGALKAYYADSNGNKVGPLLSEDMTFTPVSPVPEPATWAMLLTGVLGAGWVLRRGLLATPE